MCLVSVMLNNIKFYCSWDWIFVVLPELSAITGLLQGWWYHAFRMPSGKREAETSWKEKSPLEKDEILELLTFCLDTTYFVYKGNFYKQKHGAAMGFPVSPTVANLCAWSSSNRMSLWQPQVLNQSGSDTFMTSHASFAECPCGRAYDTTKASWDVWRLEHHRLFYDRGRPTEKSAHIQQVLSSLKSHKCV